MDNEFSGMSIIATSDEVKVIVEFKAKNVDDSIKITLNEYDARQLLRFLQSAILIYDGKTVPH